VFEDVISVSVVLYKLISLIAIKMAPKKLEKKLRKEGWVRGALGGSERIMDISIISYGENSLDLRPALGNELSS
jgi:hypothetical protein